MLSSDQLPVLQGYSGAIGSALDLSSRNSTGSPGPFGSVGSVTIPVHTQEYLTTNGAMDSNPLTFDFDEDFLSSDVMNGIPQATASDFGAVSQFLHSQSSQYQILMPAQTQAQIHVPLFQDLQLQQLPQFQSLQPLQSTVIQSCLFTSQLSTSQQLQSPLAQQPFLSCKNDFVDPSDLSYPRLCTSMFDLPISDSSVSPSPEHSFFDVPDDDPMFITPSVSLSASLPSSFADLGLPNLDLTRNIPMAADMSRISSASQSIMLTTVPTVPSPLKQQFSGSISDDSDLAEDFDPNANAKRKKRIRKPSKSSATKPKAPRLTLHRHILRSPETSRCRRMRIYSIMKSESEIESTVRFYPTRPHGKKTVKVDLEKMKQKYFND
ncbi:hypothetical protein BGX34_009684 [Mortierella sp. NVP85]|nr:hypothetical protein BGX34_009684 [Mortierella sp. NVP85]